VKSSEEIPPFVDFLGALAELRHDLERLEWEAVRLVRSTGVSWEAIGEELGISRQAATRRFSHPKPRRKPRGG
jgi:predicted DNA-binding protein (UPF0251 family)